MTLAVTLCMMWLPNGACIHATTFTFRADEWDMKPCALLVPEQLRPQIINCVKTRERTL